MTLPCSQTIGLFLFSLVSLGFLRNSFTSGYRNSLQSSISLIITSTVLDLITLLPWRSQSLSIYEGFENNQYTVGVIIDLKKAFDTVNDEMLLDKLSFYGIREIPLAWLASYLSHAQTTVCHGS